MKWAQGLRDTLVNGHISVGSAHKILCLGPGVGGPGCLQRVPSAISTPMIASTQGRWRRRGRETSVSSTIVAVSVTGLCVRTVAARGIAGMAGQLGIFPSALAVTAAPTSSCSREASSGGLASARTYVSRRQVHWLGVGVRLRLLSRESAEVSAFWLGLSLRRRAFHRAVPRPALQRLASSCSGTVSSAAV